MGNSSSSNDTSSEVYAEAQKILKVFLCRCSLDSPRTPFAYSERPMAYFSAREAIRDLFLCRDLDIEFSIGGEYMVVGEILVVTL
jgi:hypothetical protein